MLVDVLSSVPTSLLTLLVPALDSYAIIKIARSLKIFRLLKLAQLDTLKEWERKHPTAVRLFKLVLCLFLALHLVACGYWVMVRRSCPLDSSTQTTTLYNDNKFCPMDSLVLTKGTRGWQLTTVYSEAFNWALLTFLGNGEFKFGSGTDEAKNATSLSIFTSITLVRGLFFNGSLTALQRLSNGSLTALQRLSNRCAACSRSPCCWGASQRCWLPWTAALWRSGFPSSTPSTPTSG
jgi:hypothetical protein